MSVVGKMLVPVQYRSQKETLPLLVVGGNDIIVETEFERLEKEGIVERVTHNEWATPIVPVPRGDGRIRVCGDYKVTLNRHLEVDQYPLPKPHELISE